ncbi:MAG: hypothetical protein LBH79_10050 [Nitrososphaerota archaeon]|jgi:NAD-dependent SIR2 family protein deacetylase|nr:hypothetical protein [Nitrososphaerota archaeon]
MNTNFEQKDQTSEEWAYNLWTDNNDWCTKCKNKNNKLTFDDQTKTTTCTQCNHTQTYEENDWKILQAKRYAIYQYMPGKYFFNNQTTEEIFQKYLREHNHNDWSSWIIHDYVLARMRDDKTIQNKLRDASKLIVEKMDYDPKPWQTLFEKLDAQDTEIFHQVPQIIYEYAEKHLHTATTKENLTITIRGYLSKLSSIYCYNRWKADRVACWITSETIKLCNVDNYTINFYTQLFSCDPLLEKFQEDIISGKKQTIDIKDTYIQWELKQADTYLKQSSPFVAVEAAYCALGAKLGIHEIWPSTKKLPFDIHTVKKVTTLLNEPELFRFYDLATDLDGVDSTKACYYASLFVEKVKKILPELTSIEQEQSKQNAYIT